MSIDGNEKLIELTKFDSAVLTMLEVSTRLRDLASGTAIIIMHTAVSVNTFFPRISFVSLLEHIMEVTTLNIIRSFTLRFRIQWRIIFHAVEDDINH